MKFKKITAVLAAAMLTLSCVGSAMAADVKVPIEFDTSVANTVTGYIAEITYDPNEIAPILTGTDIIDEECYAENKTGRGYLTADNVEAGKIVLGWADKEHYDMAELGNVLANINFSVLDESATETTVATKFYQIARYPDVILDGEYNNTVTVKLSTVDTGNTDTDEIISGSAVDVE